VPKNHVDDEYALAGTRDPKICVTTSRDPSSRLKQFAKEVKLMFPNSQAINRGNTKVPELVHVSSVGHETYFRWQQKVLMLILSSHPSSNVVVTTKFLLMDGILTLSGLS